MVSELRDHLLRHLQGVEKKKIEQMVLDYISKLVGFCFSSNFNRTLSSMYNSQGVVSEPIGGGRHVSCASLKSVARQSVWKYAAIELNDIFHM